MRDNKVVDNSVKAFPFDAHQTGMSLRDWFAGQAMTNPTICSGTAPEYQLASWFGNKIAITKTQIAAAQAYEYADAMLSYRR